MEFILDACIWIGLASVAFLLFLLCKSGYEMDKEVEEMDSDDNNTPLF